jgi:hypothetical protein
MHHNISESMGNSMDKSIKAAGTAVGENKVVI